MAEKSESDLLSVVLLDRPIVFRRFNEIQITLAHRIGKLASAAAAQIDEKARESETTQRAIDASLDGIAQLLTMVQRSAVDVVDQEWLVEKMLSGELHVDDVTKIVESMVGDATAKAPAKKATRAK